MDDLELERQRAQARHAARTARAVTAATAIATAHGLRVDDPRVLAQGYAVRVYLHPAPVVARVSTITALLRAPIESWLARELDVAAFLASRGAPVVPPSDALPPGPHHHDGLCVTFWRYVEPVSRDLPESVAAGRMLGELHAALRDYSGELPAGAAAQRHSPRPGASGTRGRHPAFARHRAAARQVRAVAAATEPGSAGPTAAHPRRCARAQSHRRGRRLAVERLRGHVPGPVAWDLASLDTDGAALASYPGAPDPASIALFRDVRQLHGIVWVYALLPEFPDWGQYVAPMLERLRNA